MRRNREELNRIHKEKCKELKKVRAKIAADLGVELHQTECTYEGYCSGTCPKCKSEEMKLNMAIMKKQLESADIKRRAAAAGITTMAALCLTGCSVTDGFAPTNESRIDEMDGDVLYIEDSDENIGEGTGVIPGHGTDENEDDELEGDVMYIGDEDGTDENEDDELEGDVMYIGDEEE